MSNAIRILMVTLTAHIASGTVFGLDTEQRAVKFTTWGPQSRTIRYAYRLMNPTSEPATELDVYVPLPLESPRQEIHYLHLPESPPHQVITDRHGQRLVHYTFDRLDAGQYVDLGYVVGITLKNMRWDVCGASAATETAELRPEMRQLYLKSETNYSMESEVMRKAAVSQVEGATTDFEKLVRIHDYVTDSIRYVRDDHWDPAETVLACGTGSCSEYNYVLSGLCRLAGLPTRCVGGSTNGLRNLPTTDTVYHRWTEVFLSEFGWFPVDCSRDANPIRGKRSHFGRVYVDAVVWCHQAGGEDDSLGWDYRAKAHVQGDDPGVCESHRTRWFESYPQRDVKTAYQWFLEGTGTRPKPDLLECSLLHWERGTVENRLEIVEALANAGRKASLRCVVTLPEKDQIRETSVRRLCASQDLADTLLEESRDLHGFDNWFRSNGSGLTTTGDGRFELAQQTAENEPATTAASPCQIWRDLVPDVVDRWEASSKPNQRQTVAVMPLVDQTLAGLGGQRKSIHTAVKQGISHVPGVQVMDEDRFDRWMEEQGPGSGEYWILANGGSKIASSDQTPDTILVPVCITSKEEESILYHLELKTLHVASSKYTKTVAQLRREAEQEPPSTASRLID